MKKGDVSIESMVYVVLFAISAWLIFAAATSLLGGFANGFETSICKFNVFIRANTIGNPIIQTLIQGGQFIGGGFSTSILSATTMPLVCKTKKLPEPEDGIYQLNDVVFGLAENSVDCWDQMGLGNWDPLVLSPQGQSFACFEQTMTIQCTPESVNTIMGSEVCGLDDKDCAFGQAFFHKYLQENTYSYTGFKKTYSDIIPDNTPIFGMRSSPILCDGKPHKYLVGLYFVDSFSVKSNVVVVPLMCGEINDLTRDGLYMCIVGYGG